MCDISYFSAFKTYLDDNKGDGGIKDTSKIVRNLNKMEDPGISLFESKNDAFSQKMSNI